MMPNPKMSPFACSLLFSVLALLVAAAAPVWFLRDAEDEYGPGPDVSGRYGTLRPYFVERKVFLWEAVEHALKLLRSPYLSVSLFWDHQKGNLAGVILVAIIGASIGRFVSWRAGGWHKTQASGT